MNTDFVDAYDYLANNVRQNNDYESFFETISNNYAAHEAISEYVVDEIQQTPRVDSHYGAKQFTRIFKNTLLQILSLITNPIMSAIITGLISLSLLWSLVLTYAFIKQKLDPVLNLLRPRLQPFTQRLGNAYRSTIRRNANRPSTENVDDAININENEGTM